MKSFKQKIIYATISILILVIVVNIYRKINNINKDIKRFTAFYAVPGDKITDRNRIKNAITQKIGAEINEEWLNNKTPEEKIQSMIELGKYPDFIDGGDATQALIDANALVPLEDYIDKYPNIKSYLSESDWRKLTDKDGHIYIIPQFGIVKGEDKSTIHKGEAFWIQKEVLKWDNYPNIKTLDEYFDLIERYKDAHPTINGEETIGFQILTYDWRMFCLENPPQFLAGYPNDGGAIVNPDTLEAKIYSDIPEAKMYFKKLNEVYNKGLIESETFTLSYNQYLEKLSTGAVLGMVDQYWQFESSDIELLQKGLNNRRWIPLALTIDESVTPNYLVDDNGEFYRTEEQRENSLDNKWVLNNMCYYQYLPMYKGMLDDGINAVVPWEQSREFYENLGSNDRELLEAYGYETFNEFIPKVNDKISEWYPIYSYSNNLFTDSAAGIAKEKMTEIKRKFLPKIIMGRIDQFESNWNDYIYELRNNVDIYIYEEALTNEVKRRVEEYSK